MTTLSGAIVDVSSLQPGSLLDVETKSRHYLIECLGGNQVRISGHPEYCPDPVPARIHGSVDKEGVLEYGLLERGMRMLFFLNDDRPVTTSKILKVRMDRPAGPQPPSSQSVH